MDTTETLRKLNNNPIYAPIGHEDDFKRRLFLENFNRCMTIPAFQKTAGIVIKKKLYETPSAKIMNEEIRKFRKRTNRATSWKTWRRWLMRGGYVRTQKTIMKKYKELYCTTKTGKEIKVRANRLYDMDGVWLNKIAGIRTNWGDGQQIVDIFVRIGYWRFMDYFKDDYKKPMDIHNYQDYWEIVNWPLNFGKTVMRELYGIKYIP